MKPQHSPADVRAEGTQERLLGAAERLFAERGIRATSLRAVTARARANLAAVHYHFGSKLGLAKAVCGRRIGPLNRERLRLLDAAEAAAGKTAPRLEAVLRAFVSPCIRLCQDHPHLAQAAGHVIAEQDPGLHAFIDAQFEEVVRRFTAALKRVLSEVPLADLFWRLHFLIGAIVYTWTSARDLERASGGLCCVSDSEEVVDRLVTFASAGFGARARTRRGRKR